ncbi:response regulator [Tropicimonas sp. S265A]|uniref:response regulator n=1 Tax=Tropicimonas sp. S265A TaxID=3415134 RepID=UPI003C79D0D2
MSEITSPGDLGTSLAAELPFLRRYARALTGQQESGDRYALATLETIVAGPASVGACSSTKLGLFSVFHKIWSTSGALIEGVSDTDQLLEARAQWRLADLPHNTREALLLRSIEGFDFSAIAEIMDISHNEAEELFERARHQMGEAVLGNILIIEDEGIIAMDLKSIVTDMGHTVTDVARTKDEAIAKGRANVPDLILSDIQLADKSSGIDAVNALLEELGDRPVIFITAYPERLLTGERPEPAFLITKPYSEEQVTAAVSQAMFFATTEEMAELV